jgi:hypothetical protein
MIDRMAEHGRVLVQTASPAHKECAPTNCAAAQAIMGAVGEQLLSESRTARMGDGSRDVGMAKFDSGDGLTCLGGSCEVGGTSAAAHSAI